MKKSILVLVLLCSIQFVFAQQDKNENSVDNSTKKKSLAEMSALADRQQMNNITNCLINYHSARMNALVTSIISIGIITPSLVFYTKLDLQTKIVKNPKTHINESVKKYPDFFKNPAGIGILIGGVCGLASFVMYVDAEKWTNRKHLIFTGDKLAYRF